jgi:hypothetical protein
MAPQDIAQQTLLEQGMLYHLTDALRSVIDWKLHGADLSRKLSTLRFIAQSFQRHLERVMALEEYDGYMDMVGRLSPHLGKEVDALRQEHDTFRKAVPRIVARLERISLTDHTTMGIVCGELLVLLEGLEGHNRKEADLLQEAFDREGGGEG